MSKKVKTLVIALGVLVLVGGGYYGATVYQKKKADEAMAAASPSPKLGNLESSKLVKIEANGITLEKKGDAWTLISLNGGEAPGGIELNQIRIQGVINSVASIYADRVVDENPADISVYGLSGSSRRMIVTDSDGGKAEYILGDMTPSRSSYYLLEEGDPKVYSVPSYTAENILLTLDSIRVKNLFPSFETQNLVQLRVESPFTRIDIGAKPESLPPHLTSTFSIFFLSSPYKLLRGADAEALDGLIAPLKGLAITDFVDDFPASLTPYGLDKPVKIFLKTNEASIDLLIGNQIDGKHYAKLAGAPGVFTLSGLEPLITAKAFTLLDKFALLVNIDFVEKLTVTGGERPLSADFEGKGDEGVYSLNGKKAEAKSFKAFYQAVIGLLSDAEYPGPAPASAAAGETGEIAIDYQLNTPPGQRLHLSLVPYDRDFYALMQEGTMEFLISRNQVRNIYETADKVVYEE